MRYLSEIMESQKNRHLLQFSNAVVCDRAEFLEKGECRRRKERRLRVVW